MSATINRQVAEEKKRQAKAQAIGRASTLIRDRGWCIGALKDDSGRLCLMGAITETTRHLPTTLRYDCYDAVNKKLRRQNRDIASWNDEQTSGDRVADLLESVAKDIDQNYAMERLCYHAKPICTGCDAALTCYNDDCRNNYGRGSWNGGGKHSDRECKVFLAEAQKVRA